MANGKHLFRALAIAAPLYAFSLFHHDLWRPAEPRESAIAREMIESGNWTATFLNGRLFLEKPPLYTWTLAVFLKFFGYRDWVVRIPVLLFTLGTLALTFLFARRRLGPAGAMAAVALLASMELFLEVNHGAMIDNGLVFLIALALLAFDHLREPGTRAPGWAAVFYLGMGLAFLCKGLVGVALIGAAAGGFLVFSRDRALWRRLYPALGLVILLLTAGSWLLALWLKGGAEYYRVWFIENNLYRGLGKAGPVGGWFYYVPYVVTGTLPALFLLPAGLWTVWQRRREGGAPARSQWAFVFWWIGAMVVVLSAAGSKDNQYLLPVLPPLAVLAAAWIDRTLTAGPLPGWTRLFAWLFCGGVTVAVAAIPGIPFVLHRQFRLDMPLSGGVLLIAGLWGLSALSRTDWPAVWRRLALLAILAGVAIGVYAEPALNLQKSSKPLIEILRRTLPEGAAFYGYALGENTEGFLIFYGWTPKRATTRDDFDAAARLDRPACLLVGYKQESEPAAALADRLLASGAWTLLRQTDPIGGRCYRLLGNEAARSVSH